jgi:hypothetical protein
MIVDSSGCVSRPVCQMQGGGNDQVHSCYCGYRCWRSNKQKVNEVVVTTVVYCIEEYAVGNDELLHHVEDACRCCR